MSQVEGADMIINGSVVGFFFFTSLAENRALQRNHL